MTLCQSRMVIECAFGRLKARFGALGRAMVINIDEFPYVLYTCFVLDTFCELTDKKELGKTRLLLQLTMT